jgi:hypothetical protein
MPDIDWNAKLKRYGARVVYSNLSDPETRPDFATSVAYLKLANGEAIDIEWSAGNHEYLMRLWSNDGATVLQSSERDSPSEVVQFAMLWAELFSSGTHMPSVFINASASSEIVTNTPPCGPIEYKLAF